MVIYGLISVLLTQAAAQGYRGQLRIGLADSLAQPRLTRLLVRCREEEPGTEVRITEISVNEMLQVLHHDHIDIGFTIDDTHLPPRAGAYFVNRI